MKTARSTHAALRCENFSRADFSRPSVAPKLTPRPAPAPLLRWRDLAALVVVAVLVLAVVL